MILGNFFLQKLMKGLCLVVMGLHRKVLTLVGSIFCCWGRVRSAIFGLGLENFPKKSKNFQCFSHWIKKDLFGTGQKEPGSKTGQPHFYSGSKLFSGWVRPISNVYVQTFKRLLSSQSRWLVSLIGVGVLRRERSLYLRQANIWVWCQNK